MKPRLEIKFPLKRQKQFYFGEEYKPKNNEFLLNHARAGIVMALQEVYPQGGAKVGVVAYNCDTVMNAVVQGGCVPVFLDITDELKIDLNQAALKLCDAIIVTNLFGIHNETGEIKRRCKNCVIIVDNAHGYGLPDECDFTVYSINQGKYPALGEGGILVVNNPIYIEKIKSRYSQTSRYSSVSKVKLFISMYVKALLYKEWIYTLLTYRLKASNVKDGKPEPVVIKRMCDGVSRMYNAWLNEHSGQQLAKPFMDIQRTDNIIEAKAKYRRSGIEVDTHFKNWVRWAQNYGYRIGTCPCAERLVNELIMIPNYYKE